MQQQQSLTGIVQIFRGHDHFFLAPHIGNDVAVVNVMDECGLVLPERVTLSFQLWDLRLLPLYDQLWMFFRIEGAWDLHKYQPATIKVDPKTELLSTSRIYIAY